MPRLKIWNKKSTNESRDTAKGAKTKEIGNKLSNVGQTFDEKFRNHFRNYS